MRLRILSGCLSQRFSRYAHPLPVLMKRTDQWHLPNVSLSYFCLTTADPDYRFFSSFVTNTPCYAVENVPTNNEKCATQKSDSLDDNPFLFQNVDHDNWDETWKSLLESCASQLPSLSNNQLEILLRNILPVRNKMDYDDLLKFTVAVDQEFVQRAPSWTIEQILVYLELYSYLPQLRRTNFVHFLLKFRQHKIFRYDLHVVTKFIKLMNKCNSWGNYHIPKYDYETYFRNNLTKLSISDLEVFLEFMAKVSLVVNTPNLIQEFCQFVLEVLPKLSPSGVIWFCQILKLRRNIGFDCVFLDSVVEQLFQYMGKSENFHVNAYIEVASLCREESLVDERFYPKFSLKFTHQLNDLPSNRLAEGMKWLTHFDDKSKHAAAYDCIVNNLRAKSFEELTQSPKSFILTMFFLSRVGVYPADLLDILFDPKFLAQAYPKGLTQFPLRDHYVIGQELLTIDGGVGIECPNYKGNRLDPNVRRHIQRYYCWKVPKLLSDDLEGVDFEELLKFSRAASRTLYTTRLALVKILGGANFVHTGYLLPHLPRPNLLFALSKDRSPAPLAPSIRKMIVDPSAMDSNLEWYTFGIYSFSDRASRNENSLQAEEIPKVRQLKKLGVEVLKLIHKEWLDKSEMEIEQCLRNRIYGVFETNFKI